MAKREGKEKRILWLPLLLAALAAFSAWENVSLQVEEFSFPSARLPEGLSGLRLVQLSDLHGAEFGRDNARLLSAVRAAKPDLILVTGDLVDENTPEPAAYAAKTGAALAAIAPTYFVTGNHEWGMGNAVAESIKQALRLSGVTVLSNEAVALQLTGPSGGEGTLVLAGVDDPNAYADQKEIVDAPDVPDNIRYDAMMRDFYDFVQGTKQNPFTYAHELRVQKVLTQITGELTL